jgi:hypothetical protein
LKTNKNNTPKIASIFALIYVLCLTWKQKLVTKTKKLFQFCFFVLSNLGAGAADSLSSAYAAATLPQFTSAAFTTSPLSNPALAQAVAAAAGKQIEGTLVCLSLYSNFVF